MILTRRKFIQRLGYMMAGGLIVPYVPKVFYSIPAPMPEWLYMDDLALRECIMRELRQKMIEIVKADPMLVLWGTGESQSLGVTPIGRLIQ